MNAQAVPFQEDLTRKDRSEIAICLRYISDCHLPDVRPEQSIGGPSAGMVAKAGRSIVREPKYQPVGLAARDAHHLGRGRLPPRHHRCQHLSAAQLPFAHLDPAHVRLPCSAPRGV